MSTEESHLGMLGPSKRDKSVGISISLSLSLSSLFGVSGSLLFPLPFADTEAVYRGGGGLQTRGEACMHHLIAAHGTAQSNGHSQSVWR